MYNDRTDAISKGNCPPGYTLDPSDTSDWWCIKNTATVVSPMASSSLSLSYLTSPVVGASSPLSSSASTADISGSLLKDLLTSSLSPSLNTKQESSAASVPSLNMRQESSAASVAPLSTRQESSSAIMPLTIDDKLNHLIQAQDEIQKGIRQILSHRNKMETMSGPRMRGDRESIRTLIREMGEKRNTTPASTVQSNNGTANNGSANNGSENNGAVNNGSENNGAVNNGYANNGSENNGAVNNNGNPVNEEAYNQDGGRRRKTRNKRKRGTRKPRRRI